MLKKLVMAAMVVVYCSFGQMFASAGFLDPSFDHFGTPPGTVFTQIGNSASIYGIAIQSDGKIVVTGYGSPFAAATARYNTDGSLDTSFGTNGIVSMPVSAEGFAIAIQPDGKIVVTGYDFSANPARFIVIRYNTDGTLDNTFGVNGIQRTIAGTLDSISTALVIQPDGMIVVAGYASFVGVQKVAVARYTTAGVLDTNFGTNGIQITPIGAYAAALGIALQPDGKIVVTGYGVGTNQDIAVIRYTTAGVLDNTFGAGGIRLTSINTSDSGNGIAIQPDGNIIVVGQADPGGLPQCIVLRYTPAGDLDTTFGTSAPGYTLTAIEGSNSGANALVLQQNGKIVLAGSKTSTSFALARYTTTGALDTSFGSAGTIVTPISTVYAQAYALALQSDGKLVVGGFGDVPTRGPAVNQFVLARYFGDPTTSNTCAVRLINKYGTRLIAQD